MERFFLDFKAEIEKDKNKGAILMGVLRGKLSEGFDFSDDLARMVIVVGIPYPLYTEPRIILKKDYLDRRRAKKQSF